LGGPAGGPGQAACGTCFLRTVHAVPVDTLGAALYSQRQPNSAYMSVRKIQLGQLWKQDATGDIYLVTRLYSEALNTVVVLRKSGSEGEAQLRVRVERGGRGQTIVGFSPAQEEESY
jgi:hypothetical protein